jgi:hypothetical protein
MSRTSITNTLWGRRTVAGFLTWLIPFLASVPFYSRDGVLLIDIALFKSLMVVTGSVIAAVLIIWFFAIVKTSYTREAVITGIFWLILNWALDLVVLVGLLGIAPADYMTRIGLSYFVIPAMVIATGIVADKASGKEKTRPELFVSMHCFLTSGSIDICTVVKNCTRKLCSDPTTLAARETSAAPETQAHAR